MEMDTEEAGVHETSSSTSRLRVPDEAPFLFFFFAFFFSSSPDKYLFRYSALLVIVPLQQRC